MGRQKKRAIVPTQYACQKRRTDIHATNAEEAGISALGIEGRNTHAAGDARSSINPTGVLRRRAARPMTDDGVVHDAPSWRIMNQTPPCMLTP
jgi:hypothetical protein